MENTKTDKNSKFFNLTNIIIITFITAMFVIGIKILDVEEDIQEIENMGFKKNITSEQNQENMISAEITTLLYNQNGEMINVVGFLINESDLKKKMEYSVYYNNELVETNIADKKMLPDCEECTDHVITSQIQISDIKKEDLFNFKVSYINSNKNEIFIPINEEVMIYE